MNVSKLLLGIVGATLVAGGAGLALAQEWRGRGGPSIELFSDYNFGGERRVFFAEDGNIASVGFNDTALSARVRGRWVLCEHANFAGTCRTLTGDVPNLDAIGLGRRATSLRPEDDFGDWRGGGPFLVLYEQELGGGRQVRLDRAEDDFRRLGFNDAARSLRARGSWVVCQHAFYGGLCRTVRGEIDDLRAIGLWGAISSARPADEFPGGGHDGGGYDRGATGGQGRTAAFYPQPRRFGEPIPANPSTADAFCRAQGFRGAEYYASGWSGGRRGEALEDVLCVR